jgi:hypothetical protein
MTGHVVIPSPCPAGTFGNITGGLDASVCTGKVATCFSHTYLTPIWCLACPPKFYCEGSNTPVPTGECFAGFYCTGGASTPTQNTTQPGHYSAAGAHMQTPCGPGFYQPESSSAICLPCPSRFFCPSPGKTVSVSSTSSRYLHDKRRDELSNNM